MDIVGKEVAEGLNEPDSIEAFEQLNEDEEIDVQAVPVSQLSRKRSNSVNLFIWSILTYILL